MTTLKTYIITITTPDGVISPIPLDAVDPAHALIGACDLITKRAAEFDLNSTVEIIDFAGVRVGASAATRTTIAEMIENP